MLPDKKYRELIMEAVTDSITMASPKPKSVSLYNKVYGLQGKLKDLLNVIGYREKAKQPEVISNNDMTTFYIAIERFSGEVDKIKGLLSEENEEPEIDQKTDEIKESVENPLNGLNKQKAIKIVNKILATGTSGFFEDEYWTPINKLFKLLKEKNIEYVVSSTEYRKNEKHVPESKVWKIEVPFIDEKGKETTLYGNIVASGAGSVENPLERYDVVAYVS